MWNDLWKERRGTCIGVAAGIFFGIIYLFVGFWDTLIFAFIVYVGYTVGSRLDRGEPSIMLDGVWRWLTERWRMFR